MTTNIPNVNSSNVSEVVELLYDYIDLSIIYLNYYNYNIGILEYLDKYPDLYFIDERSAVLAGLYEVMHTLRRIFGFDERVNFFYKVKYYVNNSFRFITI